MTGENSTPRRALLAKIGLFFNGIIGAALAVPIVGYLLSPVTRERKPGYLSWLSLGRLEQFPSGQTRFASYPQPARQSL